MSFSNNMRRTLAKLESMPDFLQPKLRSWAIGRTIPFVATAGLKIETLEERRLVVSIENVKKVQNHIGTVHAAASALLAETATGLVVGMNVHDNAIPLMKTMKISYVRRAQGDLRAIAELPEAEALRLQTEEKGDLIVPVQVRDETGEETIMCEMNWAWVPKKRPA
ncbi:MAG: DUF4442 domain-containing protein [Pseudomonadota bacterium]